MGCLITGEVEIPDPPNCPPSIEPVATSHPLNRIVMIDLREEPSETRFELDIVDCNEQQPVTVRALLDYSPDLLRPPTSFLIYDMEHGGSAERGTIEIVLSHTEPAIAGDTGPGRCHKLEVFASGQFRGLAGVQALEPVVEGDLGTAVWWLSVVDESNRTVDLATCP